MRLLARLRWRRGGASTATRLSVLERDLALVALQRQRLVVLPQVTVQPSMSMPTMRMLTAELEQKATVQRKMQPRGAARMMESRRLPALWQPRRLQLLLLLLSMLARGPKALMSTMRARASLLMLRRSRSLRSSAKALFCGANAGGRFAR